jgi:hypothetical protein
MIPRPRPRGEASSSDNLLLEGEVQRRWCSSTMPTSAHPQQRIIARARATSRTRSRSWCTTKIASSAAVLLVEERGLWSADDPEHFRHRDVRDLDVFEAASRALAANRVQPERRKELWQEPLPAAFADRLRRVPLFDFTHVDELNRLARLGRRCYERAGR